MKLTQWMSLLAVTGAMASAPLFAQGSQEMQNGQGMQDQSSQGMQDQSGGMTSGGQAQQDMPWANQQASLDAVRKLQQSLKDKGYDPGSIDGLVGPKTQSALRDFQTAEGLDASGEINAETLTALDFDSSEFAAFGIKEESAGQAGQGTTGQSGSGSGMPQNGGGTSSQGEAPAASGP